VREITLAVKCVQTPGGWQVAGIQGPLADKVLCLGILEAAKEAVLKAHAERTGTLGIQAPTPQQTAALIGG
jgi:hypothetical protein